MSFRSHRPARRRPAIRALAAATSVALGATLVALGASPAAAGKNKGTPTPFALNSSGYGTRVIGGQVPAGSDTTSFEAIGCTNRADKAHDNQVTRATLPGAGTAYNVQTDVWTTASKKVVASHGRSTVERIVVGEPTTGTLEIRAVSSTARAYHDAKGFHAETDTVVGSLVWTDPTGAEQEVEVPSPGQPVTVPGVAKVKVGGSKERESNRRAYAVSDALVIEMLLTGTRVKVAHATAEISDDVKYGLFSGRASAIDTTALDDNVSIGQQPLTLMPCQGTFGDLHQKALARVDVGQDITARGLTSRQQADQTRQAAFGHGRGRVESIDIGDGEVVAENIVGRVEVRRDRKGLQRSVDGTKVGTVTIQGEVYEFPADDTIEVPGVVRLERQLVTKLRNGLEVVALRITLLDGSGAVIDLGRARLKLKPAGF